MNQEKNPFGGVRSIVGDDHATHVVAVAAIPRPAPTQPQGPSKHQNEDSDSGRPPVKPKAAGRSSADNLRNAVAAGRKGVPSSKTEEAGGKGPAKDLHSSILDELAELGLGPLPVASITSTGTAPKKKAEAKLTIKTNDRDTRSHSRSRAPAPKNPALPSLPVAENRPTKKEEVKKPLAPAGKAKVLPPMLQENAKSASGTRSLKSAALLTPSKTASDPAALRIKLEALESSLIEEREVKFNKPCCFYYAFSHLLYCCLHVHSAWKITQAR